LQCLKRADVGRSEEYAELLVYGHASSGSGSIHSSCLYLVDLVVRSQYGTLQFSKFEELQEKGYNEALKFLDKWEDEGKLPSPYIDGREPMAKSWRKGQAVRRNSI